MNWLSYFSPLELFKVNSPINGEIKVVENLGKRILYANRDEQSGGTITGMWGKAIRAINNQQLTINNCLLLGLGGGTVIRLLNKHYPRIHVTAIEIDPVMIKVANRYFGMDKIANLNIICDDVFFWTNKKRKEKFDLIIYDVYIGKFNPIAATNKDFLIKLKSLLRLNGIILFNRHYQQDERDCQKFVKVCQRVFSTVELILSYPYSRILKLR